jgi:hypothetical protein
MKSLFEFISKSKNLLLLACLFLLFNFLLGHFLPKDHALDLMFAYSVEEAYIALGHLNWEVREIYRIGVWALDMPYMVVYCLLFSGILIKIWKNKKMVWLPVGIFIMDFLENLMVLRILKVFPKQNEFLATFSSIFTTSKWILVALMVVIIFFGLLNLLANRKYFSFESSKAEI